jgi:hypothetical protein
LVDLIGGFAREAGYHWSMPDDSQPRYASLLWPAETLQLVRLLLPENRDHSIILP